MFRHGWEKARGTVVEVLTSASTSAGVRGQVVDGMIMDVYPESGEPFRAKVPTGRFAIGSFSFNSLDFRQPHAGQTVGVEFDPKSKKVRLDLSDPKLHRKGGPPTEQDRRKEVLEQPPAKREQRREKQ